MGRLPSQPPSVRSSGREKRGVCVAEIPLAGEGRRMKEEEKEEEHKDIEDDENNEKRWQY